MKTLHHSTLMVSCDVLSCFGVHKNIIKHHRRLVDEQSRRKVLSWLEDQIIGHLDIEERSGLRDVTSPNYQAAVDDVSIPRQHFSLL